MHERDMLLITEKKNRESNFKAFLIGLLAYSVVGVLHGTAWYFFALQSLTIVNPLYLIIGITLISQAYFIGRYTSNKGHFKHRISNIVTMLSKHYENHKNDILKYTAIFICSIFITGLTSLILKEFLQESTGHLISMSYLSLPILFTCLAFVTVFTAYLAIKPMKQIATGGTADINKFAYLGSFIVKAFNASAACAVVGYCFALFYSGFIPNFSILGLNTQNSIIALCSLLGLFIATYDYATSATKDKDANDFKIFFINLFQFNENNSLRRLSSTCQVIIQNCFWATIFASTSFLAIYCMPFNILPTLSATTLIACIQSVIAVSVGTQGAISLFESAVTSHDYNSHLVIYTNDKPQQLEQDGDSYRIKEETIPPAIV